MSPDLAAGLCILGLIVASILWSISRLQPGRGGQVCDSCGKSLPATAWLPVFGFGTARQCRNCGIAQPRSRLVWEFGVAGYVLLLGWQWGATRDFATAILLALPLLLILVVDLRNNLLYMNSIYLALAVALVIGFIDGPKATANVMIGIIAAVAIAATFFALARWVFRSMHLRVSAIGLADIYVAAAVGAVVGGDGVVPAFVIAVVLAIMAGIIRPILNKSVRGRATSYGPYLCLGGLITMLL